MCETGLLKFQRKSRAHLSVGVKYPVKFSITDLFTFLENDWNVTMATHGKVRCGLT